VAKKIRQLMNPTKKRRLTRQQQLSTLLELLGEQCRADIESALDHITRVSWAAEHAKYATINKASARRHTTKLRQLKANVHAQTGAGRYSAFSQDEIDRAVMRDRVFNARAVLLDRVFIPGAGWSKEVNAAFASSFSEEKLVKFADALDQEARTAAVTAELVDWATPPGEAVKQSALALAYQLVIDRAGGAAAISLYRDGLWHKVAAALCGYRNEDINLVRQMSTCRWWLRQRPKNFSA
jgi:hypothetical protein